MAYESLPGNQPGRGSSIQAPIWDWTSGVKLTIGATQVVSTALSTNVIMVVADNNCLIKVGSAPVAANAADSFRLPADTIIAIGFVSGDKISVIQATGAGSLYVLPRL